MRKSYYTKHPIKFDGANKRVKNFALDKAGRRKWKRGVKRSELDEMRGATEKASEM